MRSKRIAEIEARQTEREIGHPAIGRGEHSDVDRPGKMEAENQCPEGEVDAENGIQHALVEVGGQTGRHPTEIKTRHPLQAREGEHVNHRVEGKDELRVPVVIVLSEQEIGVADVHAAQGVEAGKIEVSLKNTSEAAAHACSNQKRSLPEEVKIVRRIEPKALGSLAAKRLDGGARGEKKRASGDRHVSQRVP